MDEAIISLEDGDPKGEPTEPKPVLEPEVEQPQRPKPRAKRRVRPEAVDGGGDAKFFAGLSTTLKRLHREERNARLSSFVIA